MSWTAKVDGAPSEAYASSRLSNQDNSRANMASVVAWVGRAKSTPARPLRAASTSAAMSAASVFPPPVESSMMSMPGMGIVRAISTARV